MTALPLLTAILISQPAPVGLTLALSVKVPAEAERHTLEMLARELAEAGLATRPFASRCMGDLACLANAAQHEGLRAVVAVTLGASVRAVVVDLEAIRTADQASIAQLTFSAEKTLGAAPKAKLNQFAQQVAQALPSTPAIVDAPVAPRLTPEAAPPSASPELALTVPQPERRSTVPPLLLGVGAVLAAGTSAGFGILGLSERSRAMDSPDGIHSPLTLAEATRLTEQANTHFTVSLATGIATGVLATAAVVWLLTGSAAEPPADGSAGQ